MPTMTLNLTLLFNQRIDDLGGNWQYAAANAVNAAVPGQTVRLIATKRENQNCNNSFPVSMLTATVIFPPQSAGAVAENITLQGVHDLKTNDESGSVSAASPEYAPFIGGPFSFAAATGTLTISTPG